MNKTHRLIWNDARQSWIVAHEAAASRGKPASRPKRLMGALAGALIAQSALAAPPPDALPSGGQVVAGQASISQSGSAMTINQGSDKAILNWNSFSIGGQASVTFQQPTSSSVALNRVLGSDPSAIYGSLSANGQVFLINPNGVLFGQGARVDVGGLVASTLNIRDADFLAGNNRFTRDGATGHVVNQGELLGKYVALLAPEVRNEGVIAARQGTVALAAGEAVTLSITGNRLIDVQVDKASIDTLVENKHLIQADEGMVVMSAQSANQLLGQVVNTGAIEAKGIDGSGGTVRLLASATIDHSGSIDVSAGKVGAGGTAILIANLDNPTSKTTISGTITARGGSETGDGGFVETSGTHLKIGDTARIDTRASNGKTGQWLLDPYDFTVGVDITGAALGTALDSNSVTIETTAGNATCTGAACGAGTSNNGDIFVTDNVTWTTFGNSLTLKAYRNIVIDAATITTPVSFGADAAVNLLFGQGTSGTYTIKTGGVIQDQAMGAPNVYAPDGSTFTGVQIDATNFDFTSAATAFVRLDSGQSSTYGGSRTINWTATVNPDGTGGSVLTGTDSTGSTAWQSAPSTYLTSTTPVGTVAYTYNTGISNSSYYWLAGDSVNWTVNKANLTLTGSRTYDATTTVAGSTLTAAGANGETFSITGAGDTSNLVSMNASATPQALATVTGLSLGTSSNGGLASNYNAIIIAGSSYTIDKATLNYVADAQSMTAGSAIPALTGNVTGFLGSDNQAGATTGTLAFTTPATSASPAASYAIDGSGLSATNYNFVQAAGNATALTITAAGGGGGGGGNTSTPDTLTKTIEIIQRALEQQGDSDNGFKKTIAQGLLDAGTKKTGIEQNSVKDAQQFIKLAVSEYCSTCSASDKDILDFLGGVKTDAQIAAEKDTKQVTTVKPNLVDDKFYERVLRTIADPIYRDWFDNGRGSPQAMAVSRKLIGRNLSGLSEADLNEFWTNAKSKAGSSFNYVTIEQFAAILNRMAGAGAKDEYYVVDGKIAMRSNSAAEKAAAEKAAAEAAEKAAADKAAEEKAAEEKEAAKKKLAASNTQVEVNFTPLEWRLQALNIAFTGKTADASKLKDLTTSLQGTSTDGDTLPDVGPVAQRLAGESQSQFAGLSSSQQVAKIFENLFGREIDPEGLAYWSLKLATGNLTIEQIAMALIDGAQGADLEALDKKIKGSAAGDKAAADKAAADKAAADKAAADKAAADKATADKAAADKAAADKAAADKAAADKAAADKAATKTVFTIDSTEYTIGNTRMVADVAPYINEQGRTMLSLRSIANALGVSDDNVLWNDAERSVTIFQGDRVVKVVIGQMYLSVNGTQVPMDTVAIIKDSRTMLPLRAIATALGAQISWDEATRSVTVENK